MGKVHEILRNKAVAVYSIDIGTSVFEALQQLVENNIGSLVVMNQGAIAGIFSERDYARKVVLKGKSSKETPVSEIMNETPLYVSDNDSIEHCMLLMTDKLVRYLLVKDDTGNLAGVLSIGDLVKFTIAEQQQTIRHLHNYISGS